MFKTALFPTRFDEFSLPILKNICYLKRAGLQEVILLHVIDTSNSCADAGSSHSCDVELRREVAARKVAAYAECLRSRGVKARTEVTVGRLVSEIVRVAKEGDASLIVAGRQKREILGEPFIGSATDRIIRKAGRPVLVAKYQFCADMFSKVLYPTDWSICAEQAKEYIRLLHKAGVSKVIAVHVIEDHFLESHYLDLGMQRALRERAERKMKALTREIEAEDMEVETLLLQGKPYQEIRRIAAGEDVSLIVMGSHGNSSSRDVLWGSVSQRVVEYSEKLVLVVKRNVC